MKNMALISFSFEFPVFVCVCLMTLEASTYIFFVPKFAVYILSFFILYNFFFFLKKSRRHRITITNFFLVW